MDRSTHVTRSSQHLQQNLNRLDESVSNNKSTSVSQKTTAQPTIRNIAEKNGKIIFPSIQMQEYKNSIIRHDDDDSSIVESSSYSDEDMNESFKKTASEPTFSSRPNLSKEKNNNKPSEVHATPFFEHTPEDVIKKILFEQFIDLNDIPAAAKNLMVFAGVSKFNREFVNKLLAEDGMQEVSFEISKSVIPDLLASLEKDKKLKFTQTDVDRLVHSWPYLAFDCSYELNKENFTNRGLKVLKKIVCHPALKEIRIFSNLLDQVSEGNKSYLAYHNNSLELIYSLLSRKSSNPLKVDLMFKNWVPPLNSKFEINENSFELIEKIQNRADKCEGVNFGRIDLSRNKYISFNLFVNNYQPKIIQNRDYQFKFVKMMVNIAVTHSAYAVSLSGLNLLDEEVAVIIDHINTYDKKSLQHLDLSGNHIGAIGIKNIHAWLSSGNTSINTLDLQNTSMVEDDIDILYVALNNNNSLELIKINDSYLPEDHPIRKDERVQSYRSFSS